MVQYLWSPQYRERPYEFIVNKTGQKANNGSNYTCSTAAPLKRVTEKKDTAQDMAIIAE